MNDDQSRTIAFLMQSSTYGQRGPVERMETHISLIFLAGERAYKLKRAVKLPYADFSTCALRLAACEKELADVAAIGCKRMLGRSPLGFEIGQPRRDRLCRFRRGMEELEIRRFGHEMRL